MSKCTQFQPHKPSPPPQKKKIDTCAVSDVFVASTCAKVGIVESHSKFRTSTKFCISLVYFTIDVYICVYIYVLI